MRAEEAMASSPVEPSVNAAAARARLAAALLGHDLSTDPLANPYLPIHTSAVLQPVQHLLHAATPTTEQTDHEAVPAPPIDAEGGDGEAGHETTFPAGGIEFRRRPSYSNGATWSAAVSTDPSLAGLDLAEGEEERLADEWGLSEALSRAASVSSPASPVEQGTSNGSLERRLSTASDAALLSRRKNAVSAGLDGHEDDDVEVLETRSEPDLSRRMTITFADEVLGNLEQRLQAASARAAVKRDAGPSHDDGDLSDGPRLKILERTPSQRRRGRRPHSQATMQSLPSLTNIAGDGSVGYWTSESNGGLASRDSLFRAAAATRRQSTSNGSFYSDAQHNTRPSTSSDQYGVSSRPPTRLSLAVQDAALSQTEGLNDQSTRSPADARSPNARPMSSMSVYTSRFDPTVMAAQRAELVKDRPKFVDPEAGKPPQVVLMPAPLAGQPPVPVQLPRPEGPEAIDDNDSSLLDPDEEDEEMPPGLQEPKRPAGALYGRSLIDVMTERKALLKGQQRAYVPGSDGRRQMFDAHVPTPQQSSLVGPHGAVPVEGEVVGEDGAFVDDQPRQRSVATRLQLADRKAVQSVFGPDLLYQRELAMAKELEAIERQEREAHEQLEALKRDEAEQRKVRNKLRKGGAKKRKDAIAAGGTGSGQPLAVQAESEAPTEWIGPLDLARMDAGGDVGEEETQNVDMHPPQSRHTIAPSISVPRGLGNTLPTSASDWFQTEEKRAKRTQTGLIDEEDDATYQPRPLSTLTSYQSQQPAPLRRTFSFGSDDASTLARDQEEELRSDAPVPPLPFPGESSSLGHEAASVADTEDDRPLGHRFLLANETSAPLADLESDDEEPLGKRFSRLSLPYIAAGPLLQLPADEGPASDESNAIRTISEDDSLGNRFANTPEAAESEEDEDEKPLGARFSTMMPDADEVPLALHRLSLAPQAMSSLPTATLRPVDDDGRTISADSDDEPLGLRNGAAPFAHHHVPQLIATMGMHPGVPPYMAAPVPSFYPALPHSFFPSSMSMGQIPLQFQHLPHPPPPPQMQLAMAEMQMQAAMANSQAAATATFGPGASIDRWRKSVQP
ncbi:hypothetical protein JCM10908_004079 [Rhodotorula pacifica]|uniref:uncharacterized protein n=1 Tax=Rhodotorula pacifica TaxID=1495444 RepID=UPI0031711A77